jgi:5-methyltetrahydropteroyltriglutamate--homocysteine methyltransferase
VLLVYEIVRLLCDKGVGVRASDVASEAVETPEQVAAVIRAAMQHVPPARIHPCTNSGMMPLPREAARGKLRALGASAELVRAELAGC